MSANSSPRLLIRADASPSMGTGHVMRCLALAEAGRRMGMESFVGTRSTVPWLAERITQSGVGHVSLQGDLEQPERPDRLLTDIAKGLDPAGGGRENGAEGAPWVVLDGYHFGPDCMRAVRDAGYRLLIVDDYAHQQQYHCDILLNQNIGSDRLQYAGDIGLRLTGPMHALLRSEFLAARSSSTARTFNGSAQRVLVTLGGGDSGAFLALLKPVLELPDLAGCTIRIIAGATPRGALAKLSALSPAEIEVLAQADDMPALMEWADLCISAGGSTCWELCCLGVPFLTVELAANQRIIVHGLEASGIAPALSVSAFQTLLQDAVARQQASRAGRNLVDGLGADKVAARMAGSPCLLRPVSADDRELVWRIANSPEVRAMSGSTADIPWDGHCTWFERQLATPLPPFYVICNVSGEPAGYVRFSIENGEAVISIALDAKWRNRGMGAKAIELGCAQLRAMLPSIPVAAFVRPDNEASLKAFAKAGFMSDGMRSFHGGAMHRLCLAGAVVTHTPCADTDTL